MNHTGARAKCLAGGCPLERPVRQHGSLGRQRPRRTTSAWSETCRPSRLFAPRRWQVEREEQAKAKTWIASLIRSRAFAAHGRAAMAVYFWNYPLVPNV